MSTRRKRLFRRAHRQREELSRNPRSFQLTRAWLITKAQLGIWDPRMCTLHGQDPNISHPLRRTVVRAYRRRLVPTDTLRPVGSSPSYHAARNRKGEGKALDVGCLDHVPAATARRRKERFQATEYHAWARGKRPHLKELMGPNNDLIVSRGQAIDFVEGEFLEDLHDTHDHFAYSRT